MGGQDLNRLSHSGSTRSAYVLALAIVAGDQLTKIWIVEGLGRGSQQLVGDFLRLRVTRNTGAAFSLLTGTGQLLGVMAIVISAVVVATIPKVGRRTERVALAMVLGGAVGNVLDRIFRGTGILDGAVVDFIDFSFFPAFNVADSAITIGIVLLVLVGMLRPSSDLAPDGTGAEREPATSGDA